MSELGECACCSSTAVDGRLKPWPKALASLTPGQRKRFLLRVADTWFSSLPANKQRLDSKHLCNKHYKIIQDKISSDETMQIGEAVPSSQRSSRLPSSNPDAHTPTVSTRRTRNAADSTPLGLTAPSPAQSTRKRLDPILATRIAVKAFDPYLTHLDAGRTLRTARKAPRDDKEANDKAAKVKARAAAAATPKTPHGRRETRAQTGPSEPDSKPGDEEAGRPHKRRRRDKVPPADEVRAAHQPPAAVADDPAPSQAPAGSAVATEGSAMRSLAAAEPRPAGTPLAGRMSLAAAAVNAGLALASARKHDSTPQRSTPDNRCRQPNEPMHGTPNQLSRRLPSPPRFPADLLPHISPSPVKHQDDTEQLPQISAPVAALSPRLRVGRDGEDDDSKQLSEAQRGTPPDHHQQQQQQQWSPVITQCPDSPRVQTEQQAPVTAASEQLGPQPVDEPQQPQQPQQPVQPEQTQQPMASLQPVQTQQPVQVQQLPQTQWRMGAQVGARRIVMLSKAIMEQQPQSQLADPYDLEVDPRELMASPSLLSSSKISGSGMDPQPSPSRQLSPMQRLMTRRLGAARFVSGLRPRQMWPGREGIEPAVGSPSGSGGRGAGDVTGAHGGGLVGQGTALGDVRQGHEEQEPTGTARASGTSGLAPGVATVVMNAATVPVEDTRDMRTATGRQEQGLHNNGNQPEQAVGPQGQQPGQRLNTAPQMATTKGAVGNDNHGEPQQQQQQEPAVAQQGALQPPQRAATTFEGIRQALARAREIRQRHAVAQMEDDWTLEETQALQEVARNVRGMDVDGRVSLAESRTHAHQSAPIPDHRVELPHAMHGRVSVTGMPPCIRGGPARVLPDINRGFAGARFQHLVEEEEEERLGGRPRLVQPRRQQDLSTGVSLASPVGAPITSLHTARIRDDLRQPSAVADRWAPSGLYEWPDDDVVGNLVYDMDGE